MQKWSHARVVRGLYARVRIAVIQMLVHLAVECAETRHLELDGYAPQCFT